MTTITKEQMLLKDNEVYFTKGSPSQEDEWYFDDAMQLRQSVTDDEDYWERRTDYRLITHSTAKLDGVIQLQREWFVKGEDVEEMAEIEFWKDRAVSAYDEKDYWIDGFIAGAGYNAKKGEFTREEMEKAFRSGYANSENINSSFELEDNFEWFLKSLRSLQLPEKIVLSPDGELVEIKW